MDKEEKDIKKYLDALMKGMIEEAKLVRKDYEKNPSPSEMSGSIHRLHTNSPILADKEERLIKFTSPKKTKGKNKK